MKITIGLTKRTETLLRELVTGESESEALKLAKAQRDDAIMLAERRRGELMAKDREIASLSTQERQQRMALGAAEARLTEIRSVAMSAVAQADKALEVDGVWASPITVLRNIIAVTRR